MGDLILSVTEPHPGSLEASAVGHSVVTEKVALEVARLEGSGVPERAYSLAEEAFRREIGKLRISARVAVVKRERLEVESPEEFAGLSVGEELGAGGVELDLAVEPVEGLNLLAKGQEGSVSAAAFAPRGSILRVPDMYMKKIIVGPRVCGSIDIDAPIGENIEAIASAMERRPSEITVAVLDRPRHEDLIEEIRRVGARIQLRSEGDLTPAIAVGMRGTGLHAVIGIGGTSEGMLAAAVIKCLGGEMQAKMWPTRRQQVDQLREVGIDDPDRKFTTEDLIQGDDVVFVATGITQGDPLRGVRYFRGGGRTHSVVMSTKPRTVRFIDTIHMLELGAEAQGIQL
ncbi:fructose-bisphosphatase class II family protein [Rubrobacter taiwanensis]|uniref:Fructose-1,6-bisphosphatase n=1 Tax=Rubrobacter taiwanensis TaxID=185139 RepID=A0A4R1BP39_9ACTN|nr:fructose-bisphosphatase class II family protein [Rubrobacter taiwanensis]